jgi:acetylornithine deacetylase/succinyl-diaminopimelate desuccinylase-like protein
MAVVDDHSAVLERIKGEDVAELAVELGNIYSPTGHEVDACEYVWDWLGREGFAREKVGMFDDRYNVVGRLRGSGDGYRLIFNSHLDTFYSYEDAVSYREQKDLFTKAWLDDQRRVWGMSVVNCKGPMACWMIAAKAIKDAGIDLRGDLILTHVVGETDKDPVDEYQGHDYLAADVGTRYMVTHGVYADYALVAEATSFTPGLVEAGKAFFKVSILAGPSYYGPFFPRPAYPGSSPNAITQAAKFIEHFEEWANEFPERYSWTAPGVGTMKPKANIGSIRAGRPYKIARTPEVCNLYIDTRLNPETTPLEIERELRALAERAGVEAEVKLFVFRRGYEARNAEPLVTALGSAHQNVFDADMQEPESTTISMWRDINVFNELGIPSLTYGPGPNAATGRGFFTVDEMADAARVYALVALDLCNRERA